MLAAFWTLVPTVQPAEVEAAVCSLSSVLLSAGTALLGLNVHPSSFGSAYLIEITLSLYRRFLYAYLDFHLSVLMHHN